MRRAINVGVLALSGLIAASLIVVGITKAREANARIECQNNLKQIGLAISNYHDNYDRFPAATFSHPGLAPEKRFSWLVTLMAYIDGQMGLQLNLELAWDADENREPRCKGMIDPYRRTGLYEEVLGEMNVFRCPNNASRACPGWPGLTHYVGIAGLGRETATLELGYPDIDLIDPNAGFFGYDRVLRLQDIKKSRDNTMIVAETRLNNGAWTAGGPPTTRGLESGRPYLGTNGQFGGTHSGGANVLFLDGSARAIDDGISPQVFEKMASLVDMPGPPHIEYER